MRFRRARNDKTFPGRPRLTGDRLLLATMQCDRRRLAPLVVVALVGAVATLALPAVLGHALDEIVATAGRSSARGSAADATWPILGAPLLLTAGLVVTTVLAEVIANLMAGAATAESTGLLRREVAGQMLDVGPAIAGGSAEGDLVARLLANTTAAARSVVVVSGLAAATLPPIGAVVALGVIDPWLALTFVVGMITASGAVRTYLRDARTATAGYLEAQGAIAARLVDALGGARTIAAARTTDREVARVLTPLDDVRRHGAAVWRNIARLAFQGEPVVLLTQAAVIGVAGVGVAGGRLSAGEMLAASRYAVMAAGIGGIVDELATLTRARAGADRIVELLEVPPVRYGRRRLPDGPGELELRGVTAGRSRDDATGQPLLRGLDLVVPGGRTVALVGRSGTGKSLIAALAGRLSDPHEGEVLLDGVPLRRLGRGQLRRAVAYAFERPHLLGDTIAAAIGLGPDRPSPKQIRAAAEAARADPFIVRLPAGYDAVLAETPLSGGEIQRLGLARALAHDARLVILDDATSSLDTATEAQIAAALTTAMEGRTRLLVTHRRVTAARVDLVAWLDGGRIRACAPHDELWTDPDYRALFRSSADEPDDQMSGTPRAGTSDALAAGAPGALAAAEAPEAPDIAMLSGTPGAGTSDALGVGAPSASGGPGAAEAPDEAEALRPVPDDGSEDEPGPTEPGVSPGVPDVPCEDEVAASAVAATSNDPLAAVAVLPAGSPG